MADEQSMEKEKKLTSRPKTTLRRGHVQEIGNEEAVIIRLFALKSDTRSSTAQRHGIRAVDAQSHDTGDFIHRVQAHRLGIRPALIRYEPVRRVRSIEPVEAREEGFSHVRGGQGIRHVQKSLEARWAPLTDKSQGRFCEDVSIDLRREHFSGASSFRKKCLKGERAEKRGV